MACVKYNVPEVIEGHSCRGQELKLGHVGAAWLLQCTHVSKGAHLLVGGKPGYGQEAVFMELLDLLHCQAWEAGYLLYVCCCSSQSAVHQAAWMWRVARLVGLLSRQLPAAAAAGPHAAAAG